MGCQLEKSGVLYDFDASTDVDSVLYDFDATTDLLAFRQALPAVGAKVWKSFEMGGHDFIAVLSYLGASTVYRWDSVGRMVDLGSAVVVNATP
ncbi:hypothetical protein T484DRAFT_1777051 [Baffinella frigidus]|nr:hypothetical protein T484DRAFT_1777051 [Cryptophyta sp. CCMP2293]